MSISTEVRREYQKYCSSGGSLTETEYAAHLNHLKTEIGYLINDDPRDIVSDIGRRIFRYLDLPTAIAFSQVSKGLNTRSKNRWFVTKSREIVLKYVQQGAKYKDYLKDGGWQDFITLSVKAAGVAVTVAAGVKAGIHASRIPPDAPRKTITITDSDGYTYDITIIDHPEARKSDMWGLIAACTGTVTLTIIGVHGIKHLLKRMPLTYFFSATEKEIIGSVKTNIGLKLVSPSFRKWKMEKLKENLTSNPPNWEQHPELSRMICPISHDFMLFPVKDKCGHHLDYRSVVAYQLNPNTADPLECPISSRRPNRGFVRIQFDKAKFDRIQRLIRESNQ